MPSERMIGIFVQNKIIGWIPFFSGYERMTGIWGGDFRLP